MSSYRILLKEEAEADLLLSVEYYEDQLPGLGIKFYETIFKNLEIISRNPFLYPVKH